MRNLGKCDNPPRMEKIQGSRFKTQGSREEGRMNAKSRHEWRLYGVKLIIHLSVINRAFSRQVISIP